MPKKTIAFTIDQDLLKRLDAYRNSLPVTPDRTHMINLAIRKYLEAQASDERNSTEQGPLDGI